MTEVYRLTGRDIRGKSKSPQRASDGWERFYRFADRTFPRVNTDLLSPFEDELRA
jgi:hypothetical protein